MGCSRGLDEDVLCSTTLCTGKATAWTSSVFPCDTRRACYLSVAHFAWGCPSIPCHLTLTRCAPLLCGHATSRLLQP